MGWIPGGYAMGNGQQRTTDHGPRTAPPLAGFTLIEVMAVIVIITILATLVFPVVRHAQRDAREKRAMMEVKTLELAIRSYRACYGQWPNQGQAAADTVYVANNAAVIAALTSNPRREVFLQVQQSALSTHPATLGSFLDPWLHPYVIVMDENDDRKVTFNAVGVVLTNLNGLVTTNTLDFSVEVGVGVVSWGELALSLTGSPSMDLCSWQSGAKTK